MTGSSSAVDLLYEEKSFTTVGRLYSWMMTGRSSAADLPAFTESVLGPESRLNNGYADPAVRGTLHH